MEPPLLTPLTLCRETSLAHAPRRLHLAAQEDRPAAWPARGPGIPQFGAGAFRLLVLRVPVGGIGPCCGRSANVFHGEWRVLKSPYSEAADRFLQKCG